MYNNLIYFLVAIFSFSMDSATREPLLLGWQSWLMFFGLVVGFSQGARFLFNKPVAYTAGGYFKTEKFLSVAALGVFIATIYLCDAKYYLTALPVGKDLPSLVNVVGLMLFVVFLALMWGAGRKNYQHVFGRKHSARSFIFSNIKANLPIVLPWIVLSLLYDIVHLLPFSGVQQLFDSQWGDIAFFSLFLCFILLLFPPVVRRLWGCVKLPPGYLKDHLDTFCAKQGFSTDFYLWPLFEGRVLTAGVVGIVPGLRYILITPALLETMSQTELDAVMAHEIGHVKKRHLLLYVALIVGFSLLVGQVVEPVLRILLSFDFVREMIVDYGFASQSGIVFISSLPILVFMVIYFRFIFGYFIRNFERQADLYTLSVMGDCTAMVSAFEKIADVGGADRDKPNWHHFGIGERIDCLELANREPERVERQNKKVRYSLLLYFVLVVSAGFLVHQIPPEMFGQYHVENLGVSKEREIAVLLAYERAIMVEPGHPEINNNLAWLLLTSKDHSLRDPARALILAKRAVQRQASGVVLDTLATALWANGMVEDAILVETEAIDLDDGNELYYKRQLEVFRSQTYEEVLEQKRKEK